MGGPSFTRKFTLRKQLELAFRLECDFDKQLKEANLFHFSLYYFLMFNLRIVSLLRLKLSCLLHRGDLILIRLIMVSLYIDFHFV